jgi:CheY-like chemotaxis protein
MMEKSLPDIVVTDMQMPEMNGLELVESIRGLYPGVPVVVMTAQGSEEIAVTALQRGAASYVPKSVLAHELVPTVMNILSISRAEEDYDRMMACLRESHWTFELENDYTLIAPLVQLLRQTVAVMKLCDETGRVQVGVALEEAIANALYHGNLELSSEQLSELGYDLNHGDEPNLVEQRKMQPPYKDRRIRVDAVFDRREVRFTIKDEGPGFNHASIPDPSDVLASEGGGSRGVTHMRLFMDHVQFNSQGNEVTLVKRKRK